MKIGILTYHCVPNFGAQLQVTSTVGYLKRMGHEPVVLHWYPQDLADMYSNRIPLAQISCHDAFTKEFLPITNPCRTEYELVNVIDSIGLDAIIVGSDALFKYIPKKNRKCFSKRKLRYISRKVLSVEKLDGNPFFGGFAAKLSKKIPIAAFSISSQNCEYEIMSEQEKQKMKEAMANFYYITVRDEWTKKMVESITGLPNVQITPDPVFSFNQNCYFQLPSKEEIIKNFNLQNNYVLISFSSWYSSASYITKIADEVEKAGYLPVVLPMPEKLFSAGIKNQVHLPLKPIDWYALIKYSSGYIGERMHPIVVCLHNNVPFYSFDEYGIYRKSLGGLRKTYISESSKTYHILKKANLIDYMYSYKKGNNLPSAEYVMNKILNFDFNRCQLFSESSQKKYMDSMDTLLTLLIK